MEQSLPEIIVSRELTDRTEYLCAKAVHSSVVRGGLALGRGAYSSQGSEVDVTRWHKGDDSLQHIDIAFAHSPFRMTQSLSASEARAIAAALVMAADELELSQASKG